MTGQLTKLYQAAQDSRVYEQHKLESMGEVKDVKLGMGIVNLEGVEGSISRNRGNMIKIHYMHV